MTDHPARHVRPDDFDLVAYHVGNGDADRMSIINLVANAQADHDTAHPEPDAPPLWGHDAVGHGPPASRPETQT